MRSVRTVRSTRKPRSNWPKPQGNHGCPELERPKSTRTGRSNIGGKSKAMSTNIQMKLRNSVAELTLLFGCIVVALVTFVTTTLKIEFGTVFRMAIGLIGYAILVRIGVDTRSIDQLSESSIFALLSVLTFAIPASIFFVVTRSYFRGCLSSSLISLWLLGFLWMFMVGPEFFV